MKSIIHVAQDAIARNRKLGTNEPAVIVRRRGKSLRFHTVNILGPSTIVSSPHAPLPCGARVWISTTAELETA